jgi:hypothetical protein
MLLAWLTLHLARSRMPAACFLQSKIHARSQYVLGWYDWNPFQIKQTIAALCTQQRCIFKLFRGPGFDSKESIPPACVAWGPVRQPYSNSVP